MRRTILLYSLALGLGAVALAWIEYRYVTRVHAGEIWLVLVAAAFAALGVWMGARLSAGRAGGPFVRNDAAIASLRLTPRELDMLEALAAGETNKEIARRYDVSPNTVKTHLSNLYAKLEVERRTQAISKAKALGILP